MALANQLKALPDQFGRNAPSEISGPIVSARESFVSTWNEPTSVQAGDLLPAFELPDATGNVVKSSDLLREGPLLIAFYRGGWCPACSLFLRAYQQSLPAIQAKGATFAAISPELPDTSLSTKEKLELDFVVLSDVANAYAKKLGIVWAMPDSLRPAFKAVGTDLSKRNGDSTFEVPVPSIFVVRKDGEVVNSHIEPDYMKRLEPNTALMWLDEANKKFVP